MGKGKKSNEEIPRKRGRPSGKNRTPLSQEERRARNALYERERRNETAEAMAELAEAAGCEVNITNADLLATVITQIQNATKRQPTESIDELKRLNENLMRQIASIEDRLANENPELVAQEIRNLKRQRPCDAVPVPEPTNPCHNSKENNIRKQIIKNQTKTLKSKPRRGTRQSDSNNLPSTSSAYRIQYEMTTPSPDSESGIESNPSPQSQNGITNQNDMACDSAESGYSPEIQDVVPPLFPELSYTDLPIPSGSKPSGEGRSNFEGPEKSNQNDIACDFAKSGYSPEIQDAVPPLFPELSYTDLPIPSGSKPSSEGRSNCEGPEKSNVTTISANNQTTISANNQTGLLNQSQSPSVSHETPIDSQPELQTEAQPTPDIFSDSERGLLLDFNELFRPEDFSGVNTNDWSFADLISEYL